MVAASKGRLCSLVILLADLVLALAAASAVAAPADAVVQILVTADGNRGRFGSGFYWNETGQIITAYHVVEGARRIRVVDPSGRTHEQVSVTHIQPDADLALLQVIGPSRATEFIPFSAAMPKVSEELRAVGSPRGIAQQTFIGRVTAERLVPSTQFRDAMGRMIFRPDAKPLDLLPIDMTIYTGMSGGPVLHDGKAVAVLVASLNEGGALAWGIPVKYISGDQWVRVMKDPSHVSWPSFSLMNEGTRSMEVLVSFAAAEGAILDVYVSQSQQLEQLMSLVVSQYGQCMVHMDTWLKLDLKGAAKENVADVLQGDIEECMKTLIERLVEVAALEDKLAITHEKIGSAVRARRGTDVPQTSLARIGQPLPSPMGREIETVLPRLISSLGGQTQFDDRTRISFVRGVFESLKIDSDPNVARLGTLFHDLRIIAVYFNRLILQ